MTPPEAAPSGIAGEVVTALAFEKKLGAKPTMNCVGPDFFATLHPTLLGEAAGLIHPGLHSTLQPIEAKGKQPSTIDPLRRGMCDARNDLVRKAFSTGFGSVYVMASNTLFVGQFSPVPPPCPEGI